MKFTKKDLENSVVELTITIPAADIDEAVKAAYKKLSKKLTINGFRKGHVPNEIIDRTIGKDAVLEEAFNDVSADAYNEAVREAKVVPVTRANIAPLSLERGKDVVFTATFTKQPDVTLGQYKDLDIKKETIEITDEDVDKQINAMLKHHGKAEEVAKGTKVANGHVITLDFAGTVDGKEFAGGKASDYILEVGSGRFIKGFEEQLVDMDLNEEKDVKVTFPSDYSETSLAGKDAVFHCKIKNIKKIQAPELNDEFVAKFTQCKTVAELKETVKENLKREAEASAENAFRGQMLETISANASVEIPEVMISNRVQSMIEELSARLEANGLKLDDYLARTQLDMAKLQASYHEQAAKSVKMDLVLEKIAEVENLTASNEDIQKEIALMAQQYGSSPKEIVKIINKNGYIFQLTDIIRRKKAAQFVLDHLKK